MHVRPIAARILLFLSLLWLLAATVSPATVAPVQAAGAIAAVPATMSETVTLGQRVTRPLVISNTSANAATAALYEAYEQPAFALEQAETGPVSAPLPPQDEPLDRRLAEQFDSALARESFIVYLRDQVDLSAAYGIADWGERGRFVYRALAEHAERTQRGVRAELRARGVSYRPFWIVNAIQVDGTLADAQALAARAEVALVRDDDRVAMLPSEAALASIDSRCSPDQPANPVCWNIRAIGADRVWNEFGVTGQGVVVASLDTGVALDHPALRNRYRGASGGTFDHNYNWYDPQGAFLAPNDENGHGTHTTGTMLGALTGGEQFGVAPGARWIAAQGCDGSFCTTSDLLGAAQWLLAPTNTDGVNPRPDLRPMIANNSWAGGSNDQWYAGFTAAWRAAGIFPVFAAGNGIGACGTIASPGDYADVVAVGATARNGSIASFSLRGPATDGRMKPDFSAPGTNEGSVGIFSAYPGGYNALRGTSMATPHVSGLVALLYSANPALIGDYAATYAILRDTARRVTDTQCGGANGGNNVYGWGVVDAFAAVARAQVDVPWLELSATSIPLGAGANTTIDVTFDAAAVPGPGIYTARIQVYSGDLTQAPATISVTMQVPPTGGVTIGGTVRDAATGAPLAASVGVVGGGHVATDSAGAYMLTLAPGTYTLTVSALSYLAQQRIVTVPAGAATDFALTLDAPRLALSTAALSATLTFNEALERVVTITNQGTRPLYYEAAVEYAPFGIYRSDEPGGPAFQWVNLPPDAATLTLTDTTRIDEIPLGMDFPLYSYTYTETSVTSDGVLTFGWPFPYTGLSERCLPASEAYFDLLAPFRADLDPALGGMVRYATIDNGNTFVVSFEDIPAAGGPPNITYSFQTLLYRDGRIMYQYGDLGALPSRLSVGVQKNAQQTQPIGCGVATPIAPGLAIEMRPQQFASGWVDASPAQGVVAPGASAPLMVTYRWLAPPVGAELRTKLTIISTDPLRREQQIALDAAMRPPAHVFWLNIIAR